MANWSIKRSFDIYQIILERQRWLQCMMYSFNWAAWSIHTYTGFCVCVGTFLFLGHIQTRKENPTQTSHHVWIHYYYCIWCGLQDVSPEEVAEELPPLQPRYVVYSYKYEHDDGRVSYPLCFIFVSPQGKTAGCQILSSSSSSSVLKVKCQGVISFLLHLHQSSS